MVCSGRRAGSPATPPWCVCCKISLPLSRFPYKNKDGTFKRLGGKRLAGLRLLRNGASTSIPDGRDALVTNGRVRQINHEVLAVLRRSYDNSRATGEAYH